MIFELAWKNLFRNFKRTLASLLTIAFGASGLFIYQGFNNGIMNQYRYNTVRARYGHGQIYPPNYYGQLREEPAKFWFESPNEVIDELDKISTIVDIYPRVNFYSFLTKGNTNLAGRGQGVMAEKESQFFTAMNFIKGRDLQSSGEIILGKGLAEGLGVDIGENVTLITNTVEGQLNAAEPQVVGIFHTGTKEFDDSFFRISLQEAQALLDTNRVETFSLQIKDFTLWDQVKAEVEGIFPDFEVVSFAELDAVYYQNAVDFLESQFHFIRFIILFVVALGIFNIVSMSILERKSEMGALLANGESRFFLFKVLLLESTFLGALGGLIGIGIALLADSTILAKGIPMPPGPGITRSFMIFLEFEPRHFVQALILPAAVTAVATIFPAMGILREKISELLRSGH